jgi:hypothetical protein
MARLRYLFFLWPTARLFADGLETSFPTSHSTDFIKIGYEKAILGKDICDTCYTEDVCHNWHTMRQ